MILMSKKTEDELRIPEITFFFHYLLTRYVRTDFMVLLTSGTPQQRCEKPN